MADRIDVDVINMTDEVFLITNLMLPKVPLPRRLLLLLAATQPTARGDRTSVTG
ncbi:MAG: hypothetical protein ACFB12_07295 [Leptolyngbyaceae cyanobacterium]